MVNPLSDIKLPKTFTGYLIGECIMDEDKFKSKYSSKFKNPRNMVAGLLARKTLSRELADVCYIAYGIRSTQMMDKLIKSAFVINMLTLHGSTMFSLQS